MAMARTNSISMKIERTIVMIVKLSGGNDSLHDMTFPGLVVEAPLHISTKLFSGQQFSKDSSKLRPALFEHLMQFTQFQRQRLLQNQRSDHYLPRTLVVRGSAPLRRPVPVIIIVIA